MHDKVALSLGKLFACLIVKTFHGCLWILLQFCCVEVFMQSVVIYLLYNALSTSQLDCNSKRQLKITKKRKFKNEKENISEKGK